MRPIARRGFLQFGAGLAGLLAAAPNLVLARADTTRRFVFIIQRGAADGLHTVIPYADPGYAALRGPLAIDPATAHRLDGTFALHPALAGLAALHRGGEAAFLHAVASPYRERSHFDGQNVLETGGRTPYQLKDGWLNRLVGLLPGRGTEAVALAPTVPVALRGPAEVTSYAPSGLPQPTDDLLLRVKQLYGEDAQLRGLWGAAIEARGMAGAEAEARRRQDPEALGRMAAGFLAQPQGARIAMIETGGWDTHSQQQARMAGPLKALDTLIGALREGLGPVWADTVVLVATEFGRTAAVNGTGGTDHGTGAAALLAGGAVRGGRVVADWPGLARSDLYEGRDLRPTLALDAVVAAVAAETFRLDPQRALRVLFPQASASRLPAGFIRA